MPYTKSDQISVWRRWTAEVYHLRGPTIDM